MIWISFLHWHLLVELPGPPLLSCGISLLASDTVDDVRFLLVVIHFCKGVSVQSMLNSVDWKFVVKILHVSGLLKVWEQIANELCESSQLFSHAILVQNKNTWECHRNLENSNLKELNLKECKMRIRWKESKNICT